jgi:glycosyltransferase involved in cell wall biosynthesis
VLRVLGLLRSAGARVGIVFHDVEPYPGARLIDRVRRATQIRTMRRALHLAELAIFTVPPEKLSWLPARLPNAHFLPVGSNLPFSTSPARDLPPASREFPARPQNSVPTVGIFSITGGPAGARETQTIVDAVQQAAKAFGAFRLSVFGRHAELRERALRQGLENVPVELSVEGVVDPDQAVQKLSACDVLLFVRGGISSRRSSAIAGIACGLPIIAFSGSETAAPVTEAGVLLVSGEQPVQLQDALVRVLSDIALREELASRSRAAYQQYFSWTAIAARFITLLKSH